MAEYRHFLLKETPEMVGLALQLAGAIAERMAQESVKWSGYGREKSHHITSLADRLYKAAERANNSSLPPSDPIHRLIGGKDERRQALEPMVEALVQEVARKHNVTLPIGYEIYSRIEAPAII